MDKEWLKSRCIGTWLHKFQIYKMNDRGVHEICQRCQKEIFFPIIMGKTDNIDYLDYHLREALVPSHPMYYAEYPKAKK